MDGRAHIRLATTADGAAVAAIYRPAVEGIASFEAVPPTGAEMAERIARTTARLPWIVYEIGGIVTGYAYGSRHRERDAYRWTAEVSVYVDAGRHRRGVGRALYTSLRSLLAMQGLATLVAGVALPNPASVAFHDAMGFTLLGVFRRVGFKHGRAIDVAWLEQHLSLDPCPPEPIPLSALAADRLATGLGAGLRNAAG